VLSHVQDLGRRSRRAGKANQCEKIAMRKRPYKGPGISQDVPRFLVGMRV
jgi:hypothetical protein